ncbi:MAG: transcriptional regulator [Opitutales bacterium]|nr:transcriptional regulator [Opitutales bacterium]
MGILSKRQKFLNEVDPPDQFRELFEHIPDISFFVKNRGYQLLMANRAFWERLGCASEEELLGKNDFELFPPRLAEHFRRDDEEVLLTGAAKLGIVELFFNRQRLPDWFTTDKMPVFGRNGRVIGIMGIARRHPNRESFGMDSEGIGRVVDHLRQCFRSRIKINDLVKTSGMSSRQLHRKFREIFGTTPLHFLNKTRVEAACDDLLEMDKSISEIALETGFYDQSSFTQHFRKHVGMTPLRYRKTRQKPCTGKG